MGEKSESFCRQALLVLEQNPQRVPANVLAAGAQLDQRALGTTSPAIVLVA